MRDPHNVHSSSREQYKGLLLGVLWSPWGPDACSPSFLHFLTDLATAFVATLASVHSEHELLGSAIFIASFPSLFNDPDAFGRGFHLLQQYACRDSLFFSFLRDLALCNNCGLVPEDS